MPPLRKMRMQDSARAGGAAANARRRRKPPRDPQAAANELRSKNCRRLVGHENEGAGERIDCPPGAALAYTIHHAAAVATGLRVGEITNRTRGHHQLVQLGVGRIVDRYAAVHVRYMRKEGVGTATDCP